MTRPPATGEVRILRLARARHHLATIICALLPYAQPTRRGAAERGCGARVGYTSGGRRPWMSCITRTITAITSRRWMKPPRVYEDTRPRSHNTSKITKMVHSMGVSFRRSVQATSCAGADYLLPEGCHTGRTSPSHQEGSIDVL